MNWQSDWRGQQPKFEVFDILFGTKQENQAKRSSSRKALIPGFPYFLCAFKKSLFPEGKRNTRLCLVYYNVYLLPKIHNYILVKNQNIVATDDGRSWSQKSQINYLQHSKEIKQKLKAQENFEFLVSPIFDLY